MSGEPDVANLAGLFGVQKRFQRPAFREEAVGVLHPDDFMALQQIDMVSLQALQRFVQLPGGRLFGAAVHLGHQEIPFGGSRRAALCPS